MPIQATRQLHLATKRALFVAVLASALLNGCASITQNKEKLDEKDFSEFNASTETAQRWASSGDFARAKYNYQAAYDKNPEDSLALSGLAEVELKMGELDNAHIHFNELSNTEDCQKSINKIDTSLDFAIIYRCSFAWNSLGVIADINGDFELAETHYKKAITIISKEPIYYNNYGYSLMMAKRYQEAEQILQQGSNIAPSSKRIKNNLALSKAWQGEYEEAVSLYGSAREPFSAYNNIGYIAMLNKDYSEAITLFNQAIETSPRFYKKAAINLEKTQRLMKQSKR